ncbi:MAG: SDR family NAD(P)-dependent oxidoreductase [Candidatus Melainabacteria bacterium]|nr:SDR family NAD(P)-dependent oxidoreductase [Candidatus Melainabacteria bacterium]
MSTESEAGRKVLVTGASGFIGTNLVRRLVDEGYRVRTFGRSGNPPKGLRELDIEHMSGDVTNRDAVEEAVKDIEIVFHLAGLVSYKSKDEQRQIAVNVFGTKNVMEAALRHGVKRVIHTSSIAAMGLPEPGKIADETIQYNLGGRGLNYCDSKYAAELEVLNAWKKGLPALILSPGITLGEGDTHAHHHAIVRSMAKRSLIFVPPGGVTFSDINDVVDAHLAAIEKGRTGERYCLVSANLTFADAARTFARVSGVKANIVTVPGSVLLALSKLAEKAGRLFRREFPLSSQQAWLAQHNIFFSSAKAEEELDFKPTDFESTIRRTSDYYLAR